MTNDGRPPEEEVIPRGGLADLGKRLAEEGGRMEIRSRPVFELTVTLPADGLKPEQEATV